eukprot:Skav227825  [mRNA]  locus=scaffold948:332654:335245:+ [translate_table: standard]
MVLCSDLRNDPLRLRSHPLDPVSEGRSVEEEEGVGNSPVLWHPGPGHSIDMLPLCNYCPCDGKHPGDGLLQDHRRTGL